MRVRALTWFRRYENTLIGVVGITVVLLTFSGYLFNADVRASTSLPQAVYASVKSIAGGVDWNSYGWQGNVASWLDLVLILRVATKASFLLFANSAAALKAGWRRGHTVVCGLGERGKTLSEALLAEGVTVTVIEADSSSSYVTLLRAQGACVLIGDATDGATLRTARVDRAKRVVSVLASDDENAIVAQQVAHAAPDGAPPCYVHNSSPSTWSSVFRSTGGAVTPFSMLDSACNDVFLALDLDSAAGDVELVVLGTGATAQSIVIRAARVWQAVEIRDGGHGVLRIRVIGTGAEDLVSRVMPLRFPGVERLCTITGQSVGSYDEAEFLAACCMTDGQNPGAVIAAIENDGACVRASLAIAGCLPAGVRIVTVTHSTSGLLDLVRSNDLALAARMEVVTVNGVLGVPATIFGGAREELARLAHEDWLRLQLSGGSMLQSSGPLQHWEELPDSFRLSNRDQTRAMFDVMLPLLKSDAVPLAEWDAQPFGFREGEVELLAWHEHQRWCTERVAAGWRLDSSLAERDSERKLTPWLVPYEDLPDSEKQKDRDVITRIPVVLARAGFRIRRREGSANAGNA